MKVNFLQAYDPYLLTLLPYYFLLDQEEFNNAQSIKIDSYGRNIQDYWKSKNISYNLNEYNFRTNHNFETLQNNEFILAAGCSCTFGIGIDESSCWTSQLEKQLNIPVVNLGVAGSDVLTLIRNVSTYIANFNTPKAIVIQIPELTRFSYLSSNGIFQARSYHYVYNLKINRSVKPIDYQGADYHANQEVVIQQLILLQTVMAAFHVPIIYFSIETPDLTYYADATSDYVPYRSNNDFTGLVSDIFSEDVIYYFRRFKHEQSDFKKYDGILMEHARDFSHPGDLQNKVWSDKLAKIINSKI